MGLLDWAKRKASAAWRWVKRTAKKAAGAVKKAAGWVKSKASSAVRWVGSRVVRPVVNYAAQRAVAVRAAAQRKAAQIRAFAQRQRARVQRTVRSVRSSVSRRVQDLKTRALRFGVSALSKGVKAAGWVRSKATGAWNSVKHAAGAPGRYWAALKDRQRAQQQLIKDQKRQVKDMHDLDAKQRNQINAAIDRFEKNPTQANYDSLVAMAKGLDAQRSRWFARWDRHYGDLRARATRNPTGRFANVANWGLRRLGDVKKGLGTVWKYTLGEGSKNLPSLIRIPQRLVGTVQNKLWGSESYTGVSWKKAWSQSWRDQQANLGTAADWYTDPGWAIGGSRALLGFGSKGGTSILRALSKRVGSKVVATRAGGRVVSSLGNLSRRVASNKQLRWLLQQSQRKSTRYFDLSKQYRQRQQALIRGLPIAGKKPREAAVRGFSGGRNDRAWAKLSSREQQAYYRYTRTGRLTGMRIDRAKLTRFIQYDQRSLARAAARMQRLDPKFRPRVGKGGYLPTALPGKGAAGSFGASRKFLYRAGRPLSSEQLTTARSFYRRNLAAQLGSSADQRILRQASWAGGRATHYQKLGSASRRSFRERSLRVAGFPTKLWKTSVLAFSPSWYKNNLAWNLQIAAQSGSLRRSLGNLVRPAGGFRVGRRYLVQPRAGSSFTGRNIYSAEQSGGGGLWDRLYGPGSHIEDSFRQGLGDTLLKRGYSQADALKYVNREFFDYSRLRNFERPLKALVPFYQWNKGIARYGATAPLRHPFGAKVQQQIQANLIDRPFNQLPDRVQIGKDPDTEEPIYVDKEYLRGKVHTRGDLQGVSKWLSAPFLPLSRDQYDEVNLHPYLQGLAELGTGKNRFGPLRSPWESVTGRFPQVRPIQTGIAAARSDMESQIERWVAPGGSTKWKQGFDPSATNYSKQLDLQRQFKDALASFFGARELEFDLPRYRRDARFQQFMERYLKLGRGGGKFEKATTSDASIDYDAVQAARERLARQYGFDLQKDIYEGRFAKFDDPLTYINKRKQLAGMKLQKEVYDGMQPLIDRGDWKGLRSYIQQQRRRYYDPKFLKRHPGLVLFKKPGYHPEGLFGKWGGGSGGGGVFVRGKWFKSKESAARYWSFHDRGGAAAAKFWDWYDGLRGEDKRSVRLRDLRFRRYSKFAYDPRRDRLAELYLKHPPEVVKEIAGRLGLLDHSRDNWTDAQWKAYLRKKGRLPEQQQAWHLVRSPRLRRLFQQFKRDFRYAPPKRRLALARAVV